MWPKAGDNSLEGILEEVNLDLRRGDSTGFSARRAPSQGDGGREDAVGYDGPGNQQRPLYLPLQTTSNHSFLIFTDAFTVPPVIQIPTSSGLPLLPLYLSTPTIPSQATGSVNSILAP